MKVAEGGLKDYMNTGKIEYGVGEDDYEALEDERAMGEIVKKLVALRDVFGGLVKKFDVGPDEHHAFCDEVETELAVWELMCRKLLIRGGAKGREVDDELEALYDECRKEVERGKKYKDANDDV